MNSRASAMATRSDIYARPDVYEMEYEGAGNDDAHFFARLLARVRPRRVLEFACGSGRVTFTLAAALPGAEIVGRGLVDRHAGEGGHGARCRCPSGPEHVSLLEGDMRDWPGTGEAFDAVIIPCCSVSHLLTLDDRLRTWANAFRLLRPGGVFILDVRVPDLATLAEAQRVRPRAFVDLDIDATRRAAGEEARLLRCTTTTYQPHLQRADVRFIYDRFDERALAERLVTDFASHVYFPAELELLFRSAGFDIAQQYGDYQFAGVDRTSGYVVTVAQRPAPNRHYDEMTDQAGIDAASGRQASDAPRQQTSPSPPITRRSRRRECRRGPTGSRCPSGRGRCARRLTRPCMAGRAASAAGPSTSA